MATFEWTGYGQLMARVGDLVNPNAEPLMAQWEDVIVEDNETGILVAHTDCFDVPLKAVTYRPIRAGAKQPTKRQTNNSARGVFAGFGPSAAGLHNNLTGAEYRRLDGPPTAPRGRGSRVITNLVTDHTTAPDAGGVWEAFGMWEEVVTVKGEPFLQWLFLTRDLRGVRAAGRARAQALAYQWGMNLMRGVTA